MLKRIGSLRFFAKHTLLSLAIFGFPLLLAAQQSLQSGAQTSVIAADAQKAQKLLKDGKTREALAEFRALVKFDPQNSEIRLGLASALLKLGVGEAARGEARRAVELEPTSARAHFVLGFILQHDLIGRPLTLTLSFTSNAVVPIDDAAVQFSTGGRTVNPRSMRKPATNPKP